MSWWTTIKEGAKTALGIGGAAVSGASGNPIAAVTAGAQSLTAMGNAVREGGRAATEREIHKEADENDGTIDAAIKKATQTGAALLAAGLLAFSCLGCASAPSRDSGLSSGNVGRLLARPDFPDAAKAAPEWTRDSLKTVNSLEADLQRERARANQVR